MNYWQKSFWVTLITWALLSACKEDEELSRQALLVGSWTLNDQSVEKAIVTSGEHELEFTEDEFIHFLAISGEDISLEELQLFSENTTFTFNEDGSYLIDDADNSETIPGNWRLNDDESQLSLSVSNETLFAFDVQSLSSTRLEVGFPYSTVDNGTSFQIDFIFTFTK